MLNNKNCEITPTGVAHPNYTQALRKEGILVSMTESGDPRDNAVAERMNGVLKQEWLHLREFEKMEQVSFGACDRVLQYASPPCFHQLPSPQTG